MNALKLNKCDVVFKEDTHQYFLGDKELHGVTGILSRRLFADKYKAVPPSILAKAAERGSHIHKMCEMVDDLGVTPADCIEAVNYKALMEREGLRSVASEYLVTDGEYYASSIDAVYYGSDDSSVVLNDRKTTQKLDKEYLSWQLSIYAEFFERQNPHIKVEGLTATWLRGDICEYVPIQRKPGEEVKRLLEADINNEAFEVEKDGIPDIIKDSLSTLSYINGRMKALKAEQDEIKSKIETYMAEHEISNVTTDLATFSYVGPKTSLKFDEKAFKEAHMDLYKDYVGETTKKGYLTIKFK